MFRARIAMGLAVLAVMAMGLVGNGGTAWAGSDQPAWAPAPPKGKGERCVEDVETMRRFHMTFLNHQRDATVHQGIHTKKYSLKACISCHVVKDETGQPVSIKDPRHFCRECHDYVAVRPDCFSCHASRPDSGKQAKMRQERDFPDAVGDLADSLSAMKRYLGGQSQ